MKTKEFIAKVEALGFLVYDGHCYLEVKDTEHKDVVDILKAKRWVYDCEFDAFESLYEVKQTELMEFVTEYVTTQVKDRARPQYPNIRQTVSPYRVFRAPKKSSRNQKSKIWTLQVSRRWR